MWERRGADRETYSNNEVSVPAAVCLNLGGIMHLQGNMGDISAGTKRNVAPSFTGSAMGCNGI